MSIKPVSFGSLLVASIPRANTPQKPQINEPKKEDGETIYSAHDIPLYMKIWSREGGPLEQLGYSYRDSKPREYGEIVKYTYNPDSREIAKELDEKYKEELSRDPKNVILTKVTFEKNKDNIRQDKYFITAATRKDETTILNRLSRGSEIFLAQFGYDKE